jgi:hypothetical protein
VLRALALVAAAATAGYFWRAAFEPSTGAPFVQALPHAPAQPSHVQVT